VVQLEFGQSLDSLAGIDSSCLAVASKSKDTSLITKRSEIYTKKQLNCKKRCGLCKKGSMKKVVKSKVAAKKWLWWSDNGKIFNNNNSGVGGYRFAFMH